MTRRRENSLRVWLREATLEDSERVWRWRNDAETRRGSFDERDIPFDEHREWFEATIQRRDRRMYVVLAGGAEAGVVRLDFEGSRAIVSINIAPEWRGKGIGKAALGALAERAFAGLGLGQLVARVKADNLGSRKAFEDAGFRIVQGGDALTLILAPPAPKELLASSARLENLWRGSFGREYTDRNAEGGEKRARFWRNLLSEFRVSSVLEVGCNVGVNLRWIQPHVLSGRVVGIDVNDYALARLQRGLPSVKAAVAVARDLPFRDDAFDLVFTMGVLIHHAPDALPAAMSEIVRCARRYLLCGEYFAESLTEVFYRGQHGALFKQDFGARYQELFPGLKLLKQGRLFEEDGWDDVTFWLFEKSRGERIP